MTLYIKVFDTRVNHVEEATNYNTYVSSHVMTDRGVRRSIEAGVMCIEHGLFASAETLKLMKKKGAGLSPLPMALEDMVWDNPISQAMKSKGNKMDEFFKKHG